MGTLFMVNPPKRKKRRTAAQRRATAKMIAANKRRRKTTTSRPKRKRAKSRRRTVSVPTTRRKRKRSVSMARRKRRTTAKRRSSPRRRRRSTARRSAITKLRRHSVYVTNPRRRRRVRHRRYHRNPGIVATIRQGAMDAGATLVGGAAARIVSGFVPLPKDGLAGVATGLGVAVAVGFAARKVVKGDTARFIVAGAMQVPIKSLITTFIPGAGAYLGDYDAMGAYALPAQSGVGDYLTPGMYGNYTAEESAEVGVYE